MDPIRAYHIVRTIAACGLDNASALYGRDACSIARFTLRAHVARRQASRARTHGAGLKAAARLNAYRRGPAPLTRFCEQHSKRQYRAALKHDRTAYRAGIQAEFHECLAADRVAHATRTFSHFATA